MQIVRFDFTLSHPSKQRQTNWQIIDIIKGFLLKASLEPEIINSAWHRSKIRVILTLHRAKIPNVRLCREWNSSFPLTFIVQLNLTSRFNFHIGIRHLTLGLIAGWSGLSLTTISRHIRAPVVVAESPSLIYSSVKFGLWNHECFERIGSPLTRQGNKIREISTQKKSSTYVLCLLSDRSDHFLGFVRADSCPETFLSCLSCLSFSLPSSVHAISFSRASFRHLECFFFYHFY